jgi:uncharacterized membrane protein YbjE (DUF340 family)
MNDEQIKKIIEDTDDDSREDTLRSMIGDFYSKKMWSIALLIWAFAIVFFAGATYCAIQFLRTDQTKLQIMYAAIFILCVGGIGWMKIFAWQMLNKNSIKREIKRLELRIAELNQTVKNK